MNRFPVCFLLILLIVLACVPGCREVTQVPPAEERCHGVYVAPEDLDQQIQHSRWRFLQIPEIVQTGCWDLLATVEVTVNADDTVCSVELVESSGLMEYDEAVVSGAWGSSYTAGFQDGHRVRSSRRVGYGYDNTWNCED